ncbi:MAG: hypothetical protein V7700_15670 [Halioglobus sp.]
MQALVLFAISVLCIALFFTYRRSSRQTITDDNYPGIPDTINPYSAISLRCGRGACSAAREIANERFLSTDAPTLPIESCTSQSCLCSYRYYGDRRRDERERRALRSTKTELFHSDGNLERRMQLGRRASDEWVSA